MRKYFSWKMEGKPYPKTFTDDRIQRLNELGFEWRLKDSNSLIDQDDQKQDAAMMDVARRPTRDTAMDMAMHRQNSERAMTVDEMGRFEPYRTNVSIYEQRGWL